jgi:hypothetical protein
VTPDGITYEQKALVEWLDSHTTDPITRNPLSIVDLLPPHCASPRWGLLEVRCLPAPWLRGVDTTRIFVEVNWHQSIASLKEELAEQMPRVMPIDGKSLAKIGTVVPSWQRSSDPAQPASPC